MYIHFSHFSFFLLALPLVPFISLLFANLLQCRPLEFFVYFSLKASAAPKLSLSEKALGFFFLFWGVGGVLYSVKNNTFIKGVLGVISGRERNVRGGSHILQELQSALSQICQNRAPKNLQPEYAEYSIKVITKFCLAIIMSSVILTCKQINLVFLSLCEIWLFVCFCCFYF